MEMLYIKELKDKFDLIPLGSDQLSSLKEPHKVGFSFLVNECGLNPGMVSRIIDKKTDLENIEDLGAKVIEMESLKARLKILETTSK
ncbi:hypothetical protein [Cecembia lonarensis]|uniref:Uncharacterized protein n=1 Tax=Cecembia lonarensis (strain CCUG 58316 / KCTC 22772 / LW9) TaxID=1225176 RepID=K1LU08_CECL9|nr:hypothetical protein [Cecembia lonarensis]EKB47614.1 hypothetical protein B879_03773 [Cecembia lonarensis LW9]